MLIACDCAWMQLHKLHTAMIKVWWHICGVATKRRRRRSRRHMSDYVCWICFSPRYATWTIAFVLFASWATFSCNIAPKHVALLRLNNSLAITYMLRVSSAHVLMYLCWSLLRFFSAHVNHSHSRATSWAIAIKLLYFGNTLQHSYSPASHVVSNIASANNAC